jgi:hypothetical protein
MDWILQLLQQVMGDGAAAIKAILLLGIGGIGWLYVSSLKQSREERKELIELFQKQIESDRKDLIDVIEKCQEGQLNVVQTLNELKLLISTIGLKL